MVVPWWRTEASANKEARTRILRALSWWYHNHHCTHIIIMITVFAKKLNGAYGRK